MLANDAKDRLPPIRTGKRLNASSKKWLSRVFKFTVCAAALWYLSTKVTLHDYVRIPNEPGKKYLLVTENDDSLRVRDKETGAERDVAYRPPTDSSNLDATQPQIERGLMSVVKNVDLTWTLWSFLALGPVVFIISWRLQVLLATQDIPISYRDSLLLTFAGSFFNYAMPGSTGGDLYKAYHIAKRTSKRVQGVTIVILDRVVGLISFLLIAAVALMFAGRTGRIGAYGQIVGYLTVALVIAGMLFFSRRFRSFIRYDKWLSMLPFAEKLRHVDQTTFSFRYHKTQVVLSLLVTLVSHFFLITYIYFLAKGFGINANGNRSEWDLYFAVLLASVVGFLFSAIPISFQGFGLMEAVFIRVLVEGNWCNYSTMLALTLSTRIVQIIWSLPGAIVPWMGFKPPPSNVSEESLATDNPSDVGYSK